MSINHLLFSDISTAIPANSQRLGRRAGMLPIRPAVERARDGARQIEHRDVRRFGQAGLSGSIPARRPSRSLAYCGIIRDVTTLFTDFTGSACKLLIASPTSNSSLLPAVVFK